MFRRVVSSLCCLSIISCAMATTGTRENIVISSSPSGANATLLCSGQPSGEGITPITITIRRNAGDCNLHLAKAGFEDVTILIEQGVNPAYWTNMAFSFLAPAGTYLLVLGDSGEKVIGVGALALGVAVFGTDFWTGAVHGHRPSKVEVVLKPNQ